MIPSSIKHIVDRHSTSAPVDVGAIASEMGLLVYSAELPKGVSGILKRDPENNEAGFVIFVDSGEPSYRQRFTAAHEIGHYVLHRDKIGDKLEDDYMLRAAGLSNREEQQANEFAASLLMPWHLINKEMEKAPKTVEELAQIFKVSRVAMAIRLGVPT